MFFVGFRGQGEECEAGSGFLCCYWMSIELVLRRNYLAPPSSKGTCVSHLCVKIHKFSTKVRREKDSFRVSHPLRSYAAVESTTKHPSHLSIFCNLYFNPSLLSQLTDFFGFFLSA